MWGNCQAFILLNFVFLFILLDIIICLFPFLCAKAVISFVIYLLICYYVLYINVVIVLGMK